MGAKPRANRAEGPSAEDEKKALADSSLPRDCAFYPRANSDHGFPDREFWNYPSLG